MEQQPQTEQDSSSGDEAARAAKREQRINEGLERAVRTGRRIDDWTAKHIARLLDPGDGLLHVFAESGALPPGIEGELTSAVEVLQDVGLEEQLPRVEALGDYIAGRLIRSEMPYWNDPSME